MMIDWFTMSTVFRLSCKYWQLFTLKRHFKHNPLYTHTHTRVRTIINDHIQNILNRIKQKNLMTYSGDILWHFNLGRQVSKPSAEYFWRSYLEQWNYILDVYKRQACDPLHHSSMTSHIHSERMCGEVGFAQVLLIVAPL